jgi:hypothetical protein
MVRATRHDAALAEQGALWPDRIAPRPVVERGPDRRADLHHDHQRAQPACLPCLARRAADRFRTGPHARWAASRSPGCALRPLR